MGAADRHASSGIARNLARAAANSAAHGQRAGKWRVVRRALRVSRPAMANNRRRRVLVVMIPAPRPIRAVQRARLWAITWTASQAPLAANFPDGRWFARPAVGAAEPRPRPARDWLPRIPELADAEIVWIGEDKDAFNRPFALDAAILTAKDEEQVRPSRGG